MDEALVKLKYNLRLIQVFMQESLREHDFPVASFRYAENEAGEVDIKIMISDLHVDDTMSMTPGDLYSYFHNGS